MVRSESAVFIIASHGKAGSTSSFAMLAHLLIVRVVPPWDVSQVDLSRFDAAPLIAFTATKEMNYGTETNKRI
jgi:hypothetical protein